METIHQDMITVSASAVQQIHKLKEDGKMGPDYFLRVSVVGGGCSGLKSNPEIRCFPMKTLRLYAT